MHHDLAALAASQEGLLSTEQLRAALPTDTELRRIYRSGWLRRVAPRVYAVVGVPETRRYHLRLGLLSLGEHSWVSYEAAASLHALDRSRTDAVEFTIPRNGARARIPFRVHTTKMLSPRDFVVVDGFRATSATRTIIDLAHARRHPDRVAAAIDSAVRLGLSSPIAIAERLQTLRGSGRWGCRLIDQLLVDSGGHSMLERKFLELVHRASLPEPRTQVVFAPHGRPVARVDFYFEAQLLVVEVSGRLGHSTPLDRRRDAQRRNELQDLGLKVIEYTWEDVTGRAWWVIQTLRERLAA